MAIAVKLICFRTIIIQIEFKVVNMKKSGVSSTSTMGVISFIDRFLKCVLERTIIAVKLQLPRFKVITTLFTILITRFVSQQNGFFKLRAFFALVLIY